jgi:hypothetical protein
MPHAEYRNIFHPAYNRQAIPCPVLRESGVSCRARAEELLLNGRKNAYRRLPSRGDPRRCRSWKPHRGIRFRIGAQETAPRKHLPGKGHTRGAVAPGRFCRLWWKSPRLPRVLGNPPRLLPDPAGRPSGTAAGGSRRRGERSGLRKCRRSRHGPDQIQIEIKVQIRSKNRRGRGRQRRRQEHEITATPQPPRQEDRRSGQGLGRCSRR